MKKIMIAVVLSMWSAGLWCMDEDENTLNFPPLVSLFGKKPTPELPGIDNILMKASEQVLVSEQLNNERIGSLVSYKKLKQHYDNCVYYKQAEKVLLACNTCSKTYDDRKEINNHLEIKHNISDTRYARQNKCWDILSSLYCGNSQCNNEPIDIADLIKHQRNQKHYVCYYCNQYML